MSYLAHIIVNEPSTENIENLKMLLEIYPELLQRKIKEVVFNQTGQKYLKYSLLQLAYAEGDDELCHDLRPYFERIMGSDDAANKEIIKQLNEKFGVENVEEKKQTEQYELEMKNQLIELLKKIIQAIMNEQFNNGLDAEEKLILHPDTVAVITSFRKAFAELQPKEIKKGRRFRLDLLQEIYQIYAQVAEQLLYNYNQCALFEDSVLAYILLYTPENDTEKFNQGLYYLQKKEKPETFERFRTMRGTHTNFYDYLRANSSDFSALVGACIDITYMWGILRGSGTGYESLVTFISNKMRNLTELLHLDKKNLEVPSMIY